MSKCIICEKDRRLLTDEGRCAYCTNPFNEERSWCKEGGCFEKVLDIDPNPYCDKCSEKREVANKRLLEFYSQNTIDTNNFFGQESTQR